MSSRTTHLFLSNNSLRSLHGLESFMGVTSLSLAHNLVRRAEDLRPLAALARLETLSLEGNPVCGAANYRAHVVSCSSTCLKTLDRREVNAALLACACALTWRVVGMFCCGFDGKGAGGGVRCRVERWVKCLRAVFCFPEENNMGSQF